MTTHVPPEVLQLLRSQGGVARRRDLHAAGLRRRALEGAVRRGDLVLVGADVLSARAVDDELAGLRCAAVGLDGVASGPSAALVWGLDLLQQRALHEVTVARDRSRARWPATTVRRRDLADADVTVRDGLPVTTPLRTALDVLRDLPLPDAVVVVDAALRAGLLSEAALLRAVAALPAGVGRPRAVRAAGLVDARCGSALESVCRVLLAGAGLPAPETQLVVRGRDGRVVGRVDFAWPEQRLVVEADGFAFHADRRQYREDRRRTNALVLAGWTVLRFSWEDVVEAPDAVVAAVRAALGRVAA